MAERRIRVATFPRVHVGLLDLGCATSRKYGGAGFSIAGLPVEISVRGATERTVGGSGELDDLARRDIDSLLSRLQRAYDSPLNIAITVEKCPYQHIGLGTKTALLMGLVCSVFEYLNVESDREEVQKLSGRGATSGVGVHAFFEGGFIVDLGHPQDLAGFEPSSHSIPEYVPLLAKRISIPDAWRFALILPKGIKLSGNDERVFFANNTPISADEVYRAIALMYHDVVPSVLSGDLPALSHALSAFQRTGFKRREVFAQSAGTQRLLAELEAADVGAVGMSSLGPLIFAIVNSSDAKAIEAIRAIVELSEAELLGIFRGNNNGYQVERNV